jgi:hypothetical protein
MLGGVWRRFRTPVLALLALLAVIAAALPLAAASSRGSSSWCGPVAGHTIAADAVARVYTVGDTVYGCASGGAKSYKLGQRASCIGASRVSPVKVAGRMAAYGLERCGVDTGFTEVVVRRLTSGAQLHSLAATSPPGAESFQSVDSLVLKPDGAVAWIGSGSSIVGHGRLVEVRKADRSGEALLDSGSAIDPRSLRLRRSTLTWKHASSTRSATLH